MNNPRHTSLIEYILLALLSACVIGLMVTALWPILTTISEGFKVIGTLLAGAK